MSEPTYAVDCGYLVEVVNEHTCGAGDFGQHEPGCGTVPVAPVEELLRDHARLAAVEAALADFDTWTTYDTRDIGAAFLAESVLDLVSEIRAALHPDPSEVER